MSLFFKKLKKFKTNRCDHELTARSVPRPHRLYRSRAVSISFWRKNPTEMCVRRGVKAGEPELTCDDHVHVAGR